jgi:hypothetical protein
MGPSTLVAEGRAFIQYTSVHSQNVKPHTCSRISSRYRTKTVLCRDTLESFHDRRLAVMRLESDRR